MSMVLAISGLSDVPLETSNGTMITTAKTPTEVNTDYFHLLVGICMESLCSSRATQPNSTVSACLNAFYSLLDSQWARTLIGKEQVLIAMQYCCLKKMQTVCRILVMFSKFYQLWFCLGMMHAVCQLLNAFK